MKNLMLLFSALIFSGSLLASGPEYENPTTKEVIEKMIMAHGGYEKWEAIETFSFTTNMHSESLGFLRFWINKQTIDMKSLRTYQDWPLVGSKMSFDGDEVWSVDWRVGNPPSHQHSVFFYYINLPWLTQDDNVMLGDAELVKHHAFDNDVYKVSMSFKESPTVGKSVKDTYTLYIDTESYLLIGYEYTVGYGPLLDILGLPKDQEVFGPVLRKNNYIGEIEGLKFPMLFTTHAPDLSAQYGDHAIYGIKIDGEFDESRMIKPENAIVDPAKDVRK